MCGRRDGGSFSTSFLTFSLLLLVMALGFVFGRVVVARAYVRTTADLKKTTLPGKPAGAALAPSGLAGRVGEVETGEGVATEGQESEGLSQGATPQEVIRPAPREDQDSLEQPDNMETEGAEALAPEAEIRYAIQVGAYGSEESARKAGTQLTRAGYPAKIEVDREHHTYRVVTGRYLTEENAEKARGELREEGFPEAFVVAR